MAFLDASEYLRPSRSDILQEWMGEKEQSQHQTQIHSVSERSLGGNNNTLSFLASWQPWLNAALPGNYAVHFSN